MSSVLLCGFSHTGTAEDLVTVAEELLRRGHRVTVLAGEQAECAFSGTGVTFITIAEAALPLSRLLRPPFWQRVREVFAHVQTVYVEPAAAQWEAVHRVIEEARIDVVLTDGLFFGAAVLAYLPAGARPAVVDLGMFPFSVPDAAVPPYGFGIPPVDSLATRLQAFALEVAAAGPYLKLTRAFSTMVQQLTGVRATGDIRTAPTTADVWAQLTVERFEYPRATMPGNVRFLGALRPPAYGPPPEWWDPADRRPIVAVLTDTGADLDDLVVPALQAFDGEDVIVVICGATRAEVAARSGRPLRPSVHFESRMPWEYFRRERTVVVSTGDYVHTQYALRQGIPVVAAGTFGHQVETAARVAWAGVGVDLRTRRPDPVAIREAVECTRGDRSVLSALARLAAQLARHDAETALADLVDELVAARTPDRPAPVSAAAHT